MNFLLYNTRFVNREATNPKDKTLYSITLMSRIMVIYLSVKVIGLKVVFLSLSKD